MIIVYDLLKFNRRHEITPAIITWLITLQVLYLTSLILTKCTSSVVVTLPLIDIANAIDTN